MGAAVLTGTRRWRRWSELTRVERVGLYTRQSLYLLLWSFNGSVLLATALDDENDTPAAEVIGGGLVVTALAFSAFVSMLRRFPAVHPLPWRRLVPLFVASGALCAVAIAAWSGPAAAPR